MAGKIGRSGPKRGSAATLNALKNGSRIDRRRLVIGDLPRQLLSVRREARAYRRDLECAVIAAKGSISTTDAHLIDTASAATIQAGVCRWLLRKRLGEMKPTEIITCTATATRAKEVRDKAVRALQLDRDASADLLDQLYRRLPPAVSNGEPNGEPTDESA